ncbi:MAG: flagellin [Alphaproteobacteria bacterium]|nr:flagellin [Alphaproteobacteria bacterium]
MAIGDISLTLSARSNLLSLQSTENLLKITQERLATGKKINSSLDGASAFFTSRSFLDRASDLATVKDNLGTALKTVEAATDALEAIEDLVAQAKAKLDEAKTKLTGERTALITEVNELRDQIDALVNDAKFNGTNLLNSTATTLSVKFNETGTSTLSVTGVSVTATGLGFSSITASSHGDSTLDTSLSQLTTALTTLRNNASTFGNKADIITTRQDFTSNFITTLQEASDGLVLADLNEEGANLQALQARQQLGVVSLGISGQSVQSILRLF